MKPFFCTVAAQQAGETLAGTAGHYQTYVLIEHPTPWEANVFSSEGIPPALRQLIKTVKGLRSVQFLCIDRGQSATLAEQETALTVLIYERSTGRFCNGYDGCEFKVKNIAQVVPSLQAYWKGALETTPIAGIKDILVCTHGMRDKCCARFGQPFFRDAKQLAASGKLPGARLWKVSHIGGHRFAPTAIAFPDGRYYGRLTLSALQAISDRSGDIAQLRSVYRGWSILPAPLQVLERQFMLSHGWDWFNAGISYRLLTAPAESKKVTAEISIQQSANAVKTYRATIVRDPDQVHCLQASCEAARPSILVKYTVAECKQISNSKDPALVRNTSKESY